MTEFGALIFGQMADLNRRIQVGVPVSDACATMLCEVGAALTEDALARADHMLVTVTTEGAEPASLTLGAFFADNADGVAPAEQAAILLALSQGQPYFGGGGAAPLWSLYPGAERQA